MIADETNAIRDAMKKLAQAKVQGEAEAARKRACDDSKTTLPAQRPLFQDASDAPFRGFFVTEDGDIKPARCDKYFDQEAWDAWDDVTLDSGLTEDTAGQFKWGRISVRG
jgi:hypothetical protein